MEDILKEILNDSIEETKLNNGKEEFEVSMKVLCPKTRKRMAVANRVYSHLHPLLKTRGMEEVQTIRLVTKYSVSFLLANAGSLRRLISRLCSVKGDEYYSRISLCTLIYFLFSLSSAWTVLDLSANQQNPPDSKPPQPPH